MIQTPRKDNLPPKGENRKKRDDDEMSSLTSRSGESVPAFTSTPATMEPSKVTEVTTEAILTPHLR
jgi:hypothetical protein